MQSQLIYNKLKQKFGDSILELKNDEHSDPFVLIESNKIFEISQYLRDDNELQFDYLACISAVDYGEKLSIVYHIDSLKLAHKIVLKTYVPKDNPKIASIERIWRTADWHEREAYDLLGIIFENHHNLIRILCPYDWEGYPLRKDYKTPETYHNMKVPY